MIMANKTAITSQLAELEQRNEPLPAPQVKVEQAIIPAELSAMELDDVRVLHKSASPFFLFVQEMYNLLQDRYKAASDRVDEF